MALDRNAILSSRASWPTSDVDCPELGGVVRVGTLTLGQAERIQMVQREHPDSPLTLYAHLAAESLRGDDGFPLFSADDVAPLFELPFAALERVALAALKLNGMRPDDGEAARKN